MSKKPGDYEVGYRKPPKHTRWKKGQSGNPSRRSLSKSRSTAEMIDAAFAQEIDCSENGVVRRITVFEAIMMQICRKELAGEKKASAVRGQYLDFVESQTGRPRRKIIVEHTPLPFAATPNWETENDEV